ncbi:MAG: DDE-type integrase/transposase/recombinase [Candidatus Competibacteraceae bacterium]|nr:DDE-type integrase/transposase/recombinase [Candidatus Competibacteraceae bacterium]
MTIAEPGIAAPPDLSKISDTDWQIADARYAAIRPLLETERCTATEVAQQAQQIGVHRVTLYRWLNRFKTSGQRSALLPDHRNGGRGQSRLSDATETLLSASIEDHYLTAQKPSVAATYQELRRRCRQADVKAPHVNTLRARIARIAGPVRLGRREGARTARDRYDPVTGSFPNADWPLAMIQIDHTLADVLVVDDRQRLPIGRPTLTVAIDVFSRGVVGFYLALDPPCALSVGLCLAQAILPKETWLARHGIDTPWPIGGLMDCVHADNAPEFRGAMVQRACAEYGIDLHWRPVGRPHFGGHIERLCGTLNQAIHTLPGTTFSNPAARGDYPSEQKAAMTLDELERWLAVYITQVYHQKLHHGIGMSPLKKYEQGLLGNPERLGGGRRPLPADPERLRLDFLPYVERTVQPYGLRIDEIYYYHDVLKPWIHAARPGAARAPRTFVVRRDPRDISTVFFFDPELKQYFPIPYRRLAAPSMSLWELREVRRRLKAEGRQSIDENALFAGYERLRQIEAQAIDTTQNRRRAQRRDHHRQREPLQIAVGPTPPPDAPVENLTDTITPFADRQVGR